MILTACGNNEKIVMMLSKAVIQTNKMKTMISVRNDNLQNKVKQKDQSLPQDSTAENDKNTDSKAKKKNDNVSKRKMTIIVQVI